MDLAELRLFSKRLGGENPLAGNFLFAEADVDRFLNAAVTRLWQRAKQVNTGWGLKSVQDDVVEGQRAYSLPSNFDNRMMQVNYSESRDLTMADLSDPATILKPTSPFGRTRQAFTHGHFSDVLFYNLHKEDGAVTPGIWELHLTGKPSRSQVNGLSLAYEVEPLAMTAPTDVPEIFTSHHPLLAYMAAKNLKGIVSWEWSQEHEEERRALLIAWDEDVLQMSFDANLRIPVMGLREPAMAAQTGWSRHRRHGRNTRDRW